MLLTELNIFFSTFRKLKKLKKNYKYNELNKLCDKKVSLNWKPYWETIPGELKYLEDTESSEHK